MWLCIASSCLTTSSLYHCHFLCIQCTLVPIFILMLMPNCQRCFRRCPQNPNWVVYMLCCSISFERGDVTSYQWVKGKQNQPTRYYAETFHVFYIHNGWWYWWNTHAHTVSCELLFSLLVYKIVIILYYTMLQHLYTFFISMMSW